MPRVVSSEGLRTMAHVSVTINGRQYRMACDDGQENHLGRLAYDLDQRIARLRNDFGEIGDMRLTVMAALIVADELSEMGQRMRRLEEELMTLQEARRTSADLRVDDPPPRWRTGRSFSPSCSRSDSDRVRLRLERRWCRWCRRLSWRHSRRLGAR